MANSAESGDHNQLDPRIKGELEALNSAAESINKLENEIQKARSLFKKHKVECGNKLRGLSHKIGKKLVTQAQSYYDTLKQLNKFQTEAQKVTTRFQKASSVYKAAQETVSLAEQQLVGEDGANLAFDTAWQEMLNHANLRFMEAEKEKRICEEGHEKCSKQCTRLQHKIALMCRDVAKAIEKSKPFYKMKEDFETKLQIEKQNAEDLQLALLCSKQKYKLALSNLEQISEEIHMQRDHSELPKRTPGVGAESDSYSDLSEMLSTNLDFFSDTSSQVSRDDLASEFCLDEAWSLSYDEGSNEFEKDSGNAFDNFISKVSKKFNRSSSLGNINASLSLLEIPIDNTKEKILSNSNVAENTTENLSSVSSRDSTLEGAEQPPLDSKDWLHSKEHHSMERSNCAPTNKTYTSSVFLPISPPMKKVVHNFDLLALKNRETFRAGDAISTQNAHKAVDHFVYPAPLNAAVLNIDHHPHGRHHNHVTRAELVARSNHNLDKGIKKLSLHEHPSHHLVSKSFQIDKQTENIIIQDAGESQ